MQVKLNFVSSLKEFASNVLPTWTLTRNATATLRLYIFEASNRGVYVSLSNFGTPILRIKRDKFASDTSPETLIVNGTITTATNPHYLEFALTAAQTGGLSYGWYWYEVELTISGEVRKLQGKLKVLEDV